MSDLELLRRRFDRERAARKEAESLLEKKSAEVYQANQQLLELAQRTKAIVDTAAEGIVTYNREGVIQSCNRSAERIFDRDSACGANIRELFAAPENAEPILFLIPDACPSIFPDGSATREPVELVAQRHNHEPFACEISVGRTHHTPNLGNPSLGNPVTYTALIRDLSKRKLLEANLQQARKMESIGQLAAGIAHEINTPIQFVSSNLQFLHDAFNDVGELLDLFDELVTAVKNNATTDGLIKQINDRSELVDLPFLREELPDAIAQSLDGIERVAGIVKTMKEFSQSSSGCRTPVDINQSIEKALAVAANQYSDVAKICTELQSDLDKAPCMEDQFMQVILIVLANAADAISEHCEPGKGTILIGTEQIADRIQIRITDNGCGIKPEVQERIFDPFFTTKEVGKGSGQGLAFAYDVIVNKHNGTIAVESTESGCTTILISLPLSHTTILTESQECMSY
ncbi:PAS domain-containing sensor histidine kinase [Stieleria varia]|uniref:histidine kinase n=1 Tax=Stieleria varia TaxID=2528005 RepID=A0A5C5ZPR4_9BACT|nr:ATP-binding protein [Stieleria varia]TWT89474.1 C4-dicarboxylate transport sensor protein DctB [Stieleria varia]